MIRAEGLTKRYGETVAVNDLSFEVKPGVVTGFLGPNGSGKSTTMRLVLGLDEPTSGKVIVNGRPYRDLAAPMREVGALLDARALQSGRAARQHLQWVARAGGFSNKRVEEVLEVVGLSEAANRRVEGFSLGMLQRLGIATALMGDPRTLLFDEPVNGLDPEGIRWVRSLLKRLASEGRTVFVSSHLMSEMEETADHVIVIGRGRLIASASMAEFTRGGVKAHVRVVSPAAAELVPVLEQAGAEVTRGNDGALLVTGLEAAMIGELAAKNSTVLHELSPQRASLEAAFMEITHGSSEFVTGDLTDGAVRSDGNEEAV